jgi:hypothetical protein
MAPYQLARDGDVFEQRCWSAFLAVQWPSYERFWQQFVTPLTNRPSGIHFLTSPALLAAGFTDHDICCAQLHYTILRHLDRVFQIRHAAVITLDLLIEGLARLTGALDVAFELLERRRDPTAYDAWLESAGKKARSKWQTDNGRPLQHIRNYRNHVIHGRLTPTVSSNEPYVPRIGREEGYLDWRTVTEGSGWEMQLGADLVPCRVVLDDAWFQTISHVEAAWLKNFP